MGSAVSSVVGAVTGGVGSVLGQGIQGITSNVIPGASFADQEEIKRQIAALQAQAGSTGGMAGRLNDAAYAQAGTAQHQAALAQGQQQQAVNVNNAVGGDALNILRNAATGGAPSAAQAQLQSGKDQAIATQMAMANSGNLSQMLGGQKTAMDNAANLNQQAANQAAQLRATEMGTARGQYGVQATNFAGQEAQNAVNANNLVTSNTNLYNSMQNAGLTANSQAIGAASNAGNLALGTATNQQGAMNQAQGQQAGAAGGMLNGIGGAAAAMMLSDEGSKDNIQSDRSTRAKGLSDYFKNENKKPEPKKEESKGLSKYDNDDDGDASKKAARQIKEGFISDENTKKDVKSKSSMLHRFLDKLDPVTYEYKEPTGEMGKTPGTHMGIIAQDVEKAPGGESMVINTPEGKAIDMASAMGMLMSAAADAHDRMSTLEELFKSRKAK
jgi:hypothetical protein